MEKLHRERKLALEEGYSSAKKTSKLFSKAACLGHQISFLEDRCGKLVSQELSSIEEVKRMEGVRRSPSPIPRGEVSSYSVVDPLDLIDWNQLGSIDGTAAASAGSS